MKIFIEKLIEKKAFDEYLINFSTNYGKGIGIWKGEEPQEGIECFVEIDIDDILKWQKDIVYFEENYSISYDSKKIYISGKFESIEDDGYTILRIEDSIIAIETTGLPLEIGKFIKIACDNLFLYEVKYL